jgi:hypothetical protein
MYYYTIYCPCRAGGDGGLGELLKLEPIKEASHSPPPPPPSAEDTTKQTTSTTNPTGPPPTNGPNNICTCSSSQKLTEVTMQESDQAVQIKEDVTTKGSDTFKSPTGVLAGDLGKNLSIMSPPPLLQTSNKLTALPKHMQVIQLGSKAVVRSKGSSLLTSTAMRFQSGNDGLNSILDGSPDPIPGIHCGYNNITCTMYMHCSDV